MSDVSVRAALRSDAPLVVIEAPAGCGKTYQGAEYAKELAAAALPGRPLILTHTHAARSVFAGRTGGSSRIDVRTIDSVVVQIAAAYHHGLELPPEPVAWLRQRENGYRELAVKVARLLERYPMIARAVAHRHPVVVCDEHQDSSGDQHAVVSAVLAQGSRVRIFGDPLQKILREEEVADSGESCDWESLKASADACEELDHPHRWEDGCKDLGRWILDARAALKNGDAIDVRPGSGRPASLNVVLAENSGKKHDQFAMSGADRAPVDRFVRGHGSLLVLTRQKDMARSIRAFFNREIALWEGHTRDGLEALVRSVADNRGNPEALARAVIAFLAEVGVEFSPSDFGNALLQEASEGCTAKRRNKPALIQGLARCLVDDPTHRGVAELLRRLATLRKEQAAFRCVRVDRHREYWEAVRLGGFETPDTGLAEVTHRRTYTRPPLPDKAISNIHKAKGLECRHAVLMPCSRATFPDTELARRLLYVAISRASHKLLIVASAKDPSPLLIL